MNDRKRMVLRAYKKNCAIAGKYWPNGPYIRIESLDAFSNALQKLVEVIEEAVKNFDWSMIAKNFDIAGETTHETQNRWSLE